jgi:hypothetical protein
LNERVRVIADLYSSTSSFMQSGQSGRGRAHDFVSIGRARFGVVCGNAFGRLTAVAGSWSDAGRTGGGGSGLRSDGLQCGLVSSFVHLVGSGYT